MTPAAAIDALRASGMTEKVIADLAGVSQSTINKIRRGAMKPSWEAGDALVKLASERAASAPQVKVG